MTPPGVVVAGASIAGMRTAECLRLGGYAGSIVVLSAEDQLPYDRPPLSKQLLAGTWGPEQVRLPVAGRIAELRLDVRYGSRAVGLDVGPRLVHLADGEPVAYEHLVIATGAQPRTMPWGVGVPGVHVLRSLDDALGLAQELRARQRVAVVGAGFIGAEVASAARGHGCEVTVVEAADAPLQRALGREVGSAIGRLHAEHGTTLLTGTTVTGIRTGEDGRVAQLELSTGSVLPADVVVIGIGARPTTDWLEGSGLTVRDGVVCDTHCRAAPGVFAAGDVARWVHPVLGPVRLEHWTNAREQAAAVAANILDPRQPAPYAPTPYVWSDHYGHKLQVIGQPDDQTAAQVIEGELGRPGFVAAYLRDGRVVGAVGLDAGAKVVRLRRLVAARAPMAEVLAATGGR